MKIFKSFLLALVLCLISLPAMAQTPKTGRINLVNLLILKDSEGRDVGTTLNFTLLKDGDAVAAASLTSLKYDTNNQAWKDIPPGKYELHIDSLKFGSIIKQVGVLPGSELIFSISDMPGDGKQVVQGKPTISDLQKQIADLTAKLAALTAKLAELEKAK